MTARIVWPNIWWNRSSGGPNFSVPSAVVEGTNIKHETDWVKGGPGGSKKRKRRRSTARFDAWVGPVGSGGASGRRLERYHPKPHHAAEVRVIDGRFTRRDLAVSGTRQELLFRFHRDPLDASHPGAPLADPTYDGRLINPPLPLGETFQTEFNYHFKTVRSATRFWVVIQREGTPEEALEFYLRWTFRLGREGRGVKDYVGVGRVRACRSGGATRHVIDWAEWRANSALSKRWLYHLSSPPIGPAYVGTTQAGIVHFNLEDRRPVFGSAPWGPDDGLIWRMCEC